MARQSIQKERRQSEASAILRDRGLRVTPQRRDILLALKKKAAPATAQEILRSVRSNHESLSVDTVYRTLHTFVREGIVSHLHMEGSDARFEYQGSDHHHHHAICFACGKAICLNECPLPDNYFAKLEKKKFKVMNHSLEIYGYCSQCS